MAMDELKNNEAFCPKIMANFPFLIKNILSKSVRGALDRKYFKLMAFR